MTESINMSPEVERKVTQRFRKSAKSLEGARTDLRGLYADAREGAGEFAHLIDDAARDFQASWRAVLDVYSDSAGVIAANTNAQHLDLTKMDDGAGT